MLWDEKGCSAMSKDALGWGLRDIWSLFLALASQKCRAGPTWALGWSLCPVLCSHPALPAVLERTQGLVTKSAGTLPRVCKLRSASRLLLLLFVFSSAPNSPSLSCGRCRPARRGTNKGVAWLSPGGAGGTAPVLPLLLGLRAGQD